MLNRVWRWRWYSKDAFYLSSYSYSFYQFVELKKERGKEIEVFSSFQYCPDECK